VPAEHFPFTDGTPQQRDCELCGLLVPYLANGGILRYDCQRCGCFLSDHGAMVPTQSPVLTAATRQFWDKNRRPLRLTDAKILALQRQVRSSISARVDMCLRYVAHQSKGGPGSSVGIDLELDYPICEAAFADEMDQYLNYLASRDLLLSRRIGNSDSRECSLTIPGWQHLEPSLQKGGIPGRCFVVMSFDDSLNPAYMDGIKPAVEECGYKPVFMKEVSTNKGISDRILAEVRQAEFLVCDFTGHRNGCYFEAGFAHGLGREVIYMCRDTDFGSLHFDIKHLGHIKWSEPADLRGKLRDSIRANIVPRT
jgi:hypothetical protein